MLKLVLFDMDGVLFEGKNFWLELHKLMGTEKQAWQLWKGLGANAYEKLSDLTARNLWQGRSSEPFWQLITTRQPVAGIERVFDYLNANRINTAIISSGPYQLAERAQDMFSITEIRANKLAVDTEGKFTGDVDVQVDDNSKNITAQNVMEKLDASYEMTAMIGDSSSDISMAKLVRLSLAYDCDDGLFPQICSYRIACGEMSKAVDILQRAHEGKANSI